MNNNLFIHCDNAQIEANKGLIKVLLTGVCFYSLFMNNNLEKLLQQIPVEELEKHILERKEEENEQ